MEMVEKTGYLSNDHLPNRARLQAENRIKKIIKADKVGVYPLFSGWGGLNIQIVEAFND